MNKWDMYWNVVSKNMSSDEKNLRKAKVSIKNTLKYKDRPKGFGTRLFEHFNMIEVDCPGRMPIYKYCIQKALS